MQVQLAAGTHPIEVADGKKPPTEMRLFKFGTFTLAHKPGMTFTFDEESARLCLEASAKWGNLYHFDYHHAAVDTAQRNGPGAPAAVWFRLERRDDGLWAVDMQWTPAAAAALASLEYRYWSPVFLHDEEGHVLGFINGALTNLPATNNLDLLPMAASRLTSLSPPQERPMKHLLAALRLPDTASEADALTALTKSQQLSVEVCSLTERQAPAEALAVLQAWKAGHEKAETLARQLGEVQAQATKAERDALIKQGEADRKLTPAILASDWLKEQTVASLKAYLAVAVPAIPSAARPPKNDAATALGDLSTADVAVAEMTGADTKLMAESLKRRDGQVPRGELPASYRQPEQTAD